MVNAAAFAEAVATLGACAWCHKTLMGTPCFQGDALLCCDVRLAGGQVVVGAVIGQAPQDSQRALPTLTASEGREQFPELV